MRTVVYARISARFVFLFGKHWHCLFRSETKPRSIVPVHSLPQALHFAEANTVVRLGDSFQSSRNQKKTRITAERDSWMAYLNVQ